ncbi:MAG: tRNA (N(6)-L-threonylcarbamoyladenosine(37)-C(2))-methylthiotransferase MtaB [Clostridia bacterium]|nr:tRNA (N(6)-L-threonylcarbamoyladenosine(37)-C(2))-methylthiotransferase MtaB [Clostridia bacterium]
MKFCIVTLGCKVNQYESQSLRESLLRLGYGESQSPETADVAVVNTCCVTGESERKCRNAVHRLRRKAPQALIAVCGCLATVNGRSLEQAGADIVWKGHDKQKLVPAIHHRLAAKETEAEAAFITGFDERTRAYVKIEDGCRNFCTYCIIPYARGRIVSREEEQICREVEELVRRGYRELVITGIEIASYGADNGKELGGLLQKLDALEGDFRLRLGSLEPSFVTPAFAKTLGALKKLCPHIHLSLQSGSDAVLRAMNRKYDTQRYGQAAALLRQAMPGCELTTDLIVGFPGESEAHFQESLAFAEKMEFLQIHIFPYSPRKGTPAAEMDGQVAPQVKKQRAARAAEMAQRCREQRLAARVGTRAEMICEADGCGFTREYLPVRTEESLSPGEVVQVLFTGTDGKFLLAKRVEKQASDA